MLFSVIKCIFKCQLGGLGLQGNERLIRFIGNIDEMKSLVNGAISLTQARKFTDSLECALTTADYQWWANFYCEIAGPMQEKSSDIREAMLATAYVSCWHRLSIGSDLIRLAEEYTSKDFQCAVTTSIERVFSSMPVSDGTAMWLDLFNVRYLDDEKIRLQDLWDRDPPRCGYPGLEFKRAKYMYEQEVRFVMHDYSAAMVFPGAKSILALDRLARNYAAINQNIFIDAIYVFNDFSFDKLMKIYTGSEFQEKIILCSPSELLDLCIA